MKSLSILLFLFICSTTLFAQGQYENSLIYKIDVLFEKYPETELMNEESVKGRIKTREGDFFSQSAFDTDLKNLAADYDNIDTEFEVSEQGLSITLYITSKPIIRSITWTGVRKIKLNTLRDELGIRPFTTYERQAFNRAFRKVKAYYVKKGFFEAELNYHTTRCPDSNEVDIEICVDEGKSGKIKNICFENFTKCEQQELLEQMCTKTYKPLLSWLSDEGKFNEDRIQQDQFVILNYLQNKGYADAAVDINVVDAGPDRINIHISATRGLIYRFGRIFFDGYTLFDSAKIREQFRICPEAPYSPEALRETIQNITSLYGRCGYIDAFVDYEAKLREDEPVYDVWLTIEEGAQYRVGLIKIMGNCATQNRVILHETLLIPGEVFNLDCLKRTEARLRNIGYFKCVNVYAVNSDAFADCEDNYRDVIIEVEECGTGNFGAFVGFSTIEDIFGGFNITERNFNISALPCLFSEGCSVLRGGGEYAHATINIGMKSRSATISWTKPYYNDTRWSVGFDINRSYNHYISDHYEILSNGLTLHGVYDLNPFMKYGVHYRIKHVDVDVSGSNYTGAQLAQIESDGIVSAMGTSFLYDSTNRPCEPTCGYKSRFEVEFCGLGGEAYYFGTAYLNSYYIPVNKNGVLKYRADLRFLFPFNGSTASNLPIDERLFLGGENTIRGYREYRLGPHFADGDQSPKGGISMQIYSVEYSHYLNSLATAFIFSDLGSISDNQFDFSNFYQSIGVGARLRVIAGGPPLVLGYGFPLKSDSSNQIKRFFLTVGGRF